MSEATPKTSEVIQAQLATFAAERIGNYQDSRHMLNNIGSLALGEDADITRVTKSAEYHKGEHGDYSLRVPEGTKRKVAAVAEYNDFLRFVGGSRYEAIQGRAEMLKEYGRFEPTITRLRAELADSATRKEHPSYLGNGSNTTVFSITEGDKSYAVRVPNGKGNSPKVIDSHIAGAILGKGIPHLEQIVAASYEDGVTVAEIMPGKEIGQLTHEEIRGVTDEQLSELVDTLVAVSEHGIEIDPKPSNIFNDTKEGFGIVDYHSSKVAAKDSADQDLGTVVGWISGVLDNAGFYGRPYKSEQTTEDYARDLEFSTANLDVMERYRSVVEQRLEGEARQTALKKIDERIDTAQEAVKNYTNPDWVSEQITTVQEKKLQREKSKDNQTSPADSNKFDPV